LRNAQFLIAKSPQVSQDIYNKLIRGLGLNLKLIEGKTYDCLNTCDFALVASGTATLETAILQKPFVIIYRMSYLNYLLYRPQVKVPFIGIVNIIAGKKVIPEFVQSNATAKRIADQVLKTLKDHSEMNRIKGDLKQIASSLGEPGASLRAAKIILDYL
jgi:lipid-A-disaccharide synthase